jgi:adenosylhomocysteine nucleosidase
VATSSPNEIIAPAQAAIVSERFSRLPMILICCAFQAEVRPLRARMQGALPLDRKIVSGYRGRLAGSPAVLISTGIGMRRALTSSVRVLDLLRSINFVVIAGVAGALRDNLAVGSVIVSENLMIRRDDDFQPEQVVAVPREPLAIALRALHGSGIEYVAGPTMTSRRPLVTAADKRRAHDETGAISVDMESAVIALEAQRRGIPFVCIRTILDTAGEDVVGAALADENGRVRPLAAAKAVLTNPALVAGAARLLRNLLIATNALAPTLETVLPVIVQPNAPV